MLSIPLSWRPRRYYPLAILGLLLLITAILPSFDFYINITPSSPRGLYRAIKGPIQRGDYVAFCLPKSLEKTGLAHHFVLSGTRCGRSSFLIKQVFAFPGDTVQLCWESIDVNGIHYPYATQSHAQALDGLAVLPRGIYHARGYWVIGTHAFSSWDSRYWGEIKPEAILARLRPVWTEKASPLAPLSPA